MSPGFLNNEMFNVMQQQTNSKAMTEKIIEIYIMENGKFILFQTFIEMKEIMEEVGQYQFDFTPYCG